MVIKENGAFVVYTRDSFDNIQYPFMILMSVNWN